jgi:hypothetical protein
MHVGHPGEDESNGSGLRSAELVASMQNVTARGPWARVEQAVVH